VIIFRNSQLSNHHNSLTMHGVGLDFTNVIDKNRESIVRPCAWLV
jgi:hypothetical protein